MPGLDAQRARKMAFEPPILQVDGEAARRMVVHALSCTALLVIWGAYYRAIPATHAKAALDGAAVAVLPGARQW